MSRRQPPADHPGRHSVDAQPVSAGRRRPGEQVYRMSAWRINWWTRFFIITIFAGLGLAALVVVVGGLITDAMPQGYDAQDAVMSVGIAIAVIAVIGPLVGAAAMGAEALHRGGWVVGVGLSSGVVAASVGQVYGITWLFVVAVIVVVVSGLLFFVLGYIRRVPMWLGGVFGVPREGISDGTLPGESAPGSLDDRQHPPA